MPFSSSEISEKIDAIYRHIDQTSSFYGKLVKWKIHEFCYFGISLSETYIFDTGVNLTVLERENREVEICTETKAFSPDAVIERLTHALECFRKWNYSALNWNSEHLARLIVSDEPVSLQVREIFPQVDNSGYNSNAKNAFRVYLEQNEIPTSQYELLDANPNSIKDSNSEEATKEIKNEISSANELTAINSKRIEKMNSTSYTVASLLNTLLQETYAENRRKYEEKMQEIKIIANPQLRDEYAQQLLLDKFLAPLEEAQHQIQNAAKHAQFLAEAINYYHNDHGMSKEQAREVAGQFRALAVQISQIDSLDQLKVIYQVITQFTHQLSRFKHRDRKYSLEHEIRQGILNVLNTCMAVEKNFYRRVAGRAESSTGDEIKRLKEN